METPYLVSVLRFDSDTDQHIGREMVRIRQLVGVPSRSDAFPHISLVPTTVDDRDRTIQRMGAMLANQPSLDVVFSHLGYFSGGVVFLGVTPTQSLIALHRRLFEASLPDANAPWIDLYYPGRWVPHCTVALRILDDSLGMVIREVRTLIATPLLAQCMAVELLEVHEDRVQVLKRIELQLRES